jgi:hypothetical protein
MSFKNSMEAKEFLVSRIVKEAERRHVPLSETERKMLYFSESCPTLPDMAEIAERFESECDDEKYEKKISKLARSAYRRDRKESPETARLWKEAIKVLQKEDHYILVMLDVPRSGSDVRKLILTALVLVALGLCVVVGVDWIRHHVLIRIPDTVQLAAFILALVVLLILGLSEKAGKFLQRLMERIFRW